MIARLRQRLPDLAGPVLNRLLFWTAALLVISVVAFAVYYYFDQRGGRGAEGPLEHQIATLEGAVRANPDDASARGALAQAYFTDHRYKEAAQQYDAVLSNDDKNPVALIGLGRSLLETGDRDAALGRFQQVLDIAAQGEMSADLVETAQFYLGSIYLDQKQADDAVDHLQKAVAIERTDADAWRVLGAALVEAGKPDEAIDALKQAVLFVPNYAEAYETMVVAYEQKGLTAETHYARGMLSYSRGQFDEAVTELAAALQASPNYAAAYVGMGLARESRSERDLALAAYQQALQLEPDNFNARAGLTRLGAPPPVATPQPQEVNP
ncbi:MAG TPA: tetratricopeptide repeat protein [Dehalococcoidia bacterium]|nr:tetratricopeptide repeat protein [Dehalococcoidia bacterium]